MSRFLAQTAEEKAIPKPTARLTNKLITDFLYIVITSKITNIRLYHVDHIGRCLF